jgi:hypothetical protein
MLRIPMLGPRETTIYVTFNAASSTKQSNRLEAEFEHSDRLSKTKVNLDRTCGVRDPPSLSQSIAIRPRLRVALRRSSV